MFAWYGTAAQTVLVQGNWKGLGSYGTLGLEMVLGVVLPCYVGSLADRHYKTGQWFVALGFCLGIAHAVRAVYRAVQRANREAEEEEQRLRAARKKYHEKPN
jgi:F0F1-type ATP synthase assembly protein I